MASVTVVDDPLDNRCSRDDGGRRGGGAAKTALALGGGGVVVLLTARSFSVSFQDDGTVSCGMPLLGIAGNFVMQQQQCGGGCAVSEWSSWSVWWHLRSMMESPLHRSGYRTEKMWQTQNKPVKTD